MPQQPFPFLTEKFQSLKEEENQFKTSSATSRLHPADMSKTRLTVSKTALRSSRTKMEQEPADWNIAYHWTPSTEQGFNYIFPYVDLGTCSILNLLWYCWPFPKMPSLTFSTLILFPLLFWTGCGRWLPLPVPGSARDVFLSFSYKRILLSHLATTSLRFSLLNFSVFFLQYNMSWGNCCWELSLYESKWTELTDTTNVVNIMVQIFYKTVLSMNGGWASYSFY